MSWHYFENVKPLKTKLAIIIANMLIIPIRRGDDLSHFVFNMTSSLGSSL